MPKRLSNEGDRKVTRTISFHRSVLESLVYYCETEELNINTVVDKVVDKYIKDVQRGDDDE